MEDQSTPIMTPATAGRTRISRREARRHRSALLPTNTTTSRSISALGTVILAFAGGAFFAAASSSTAEPPSLLLPDVLPSAARPADYVASGSGAGADAPSVAASLSAHENGDDVVVEEEEEEEEWRRSLPPLLRRRRGTLRRLILPAGDQEDEGCELYLLGTSHVSRDSCDDARLLVEHVKPHCLFLELCPQRLALLSDEAHAVPPPGSSATTHEVVEGGGGRSVAEEARELRAQNPGMTRASSMSAALLTKIQGDYATKLGVTIGGEFRESYKVAGGQQTAFETAVWKRRHEAQWNPRAAPDVDLATDEDNVHGCVAVLGDRPVRLTLARVWESLSFLGKARLVLGLIWSSLRQPSEKELREWMDSIMNDPGNDLLSKSIEELGRHFPTVEEVIIHERDRYMAAKLTQTARLLGGVPSSTSTPPGQQRKWTRKRIVAVVGAGHCPGMCTLLQNSHYFSEKSPEEVLRSVVETKHSTVENSNDIRSLTTDVTELHFP